MTFRFARLALIFPFVVGALATNGESLSFAGLSDLAGPFEGVDRMGHAFFLLKLGNVGKIPVYAYWSSSAKETSPLLGAGWDVPLLSSRIYPISSKCLKLHLPDGYVRHFHLGKDGVYRGGRMWTANLDGDTTRVVADSEDGFPRTVLVFFKGRLTRMECEEGVFDFKRNPRSGWTVVSKGTQLLSAVPDALDGNRIQMRIGNVRLAVVKEMADVTVPSHDDSSPQCLRMPCLATLSFSTGERHAFSYGADAWSAWLDADGQRLVWNQATGRVTAWKGNAFEVGRIPNDGVSGPKISRTDPSGRSESYAHDVRKGVVTEELENGVTVVTRLFTSGDNAGRVRWRERRERGTCMERVDYIYDGRGRVVDRLVRTSRN